MTFNRSNPSINPLDLTTNPNTQPEQIEIAGEEVTAMGNDSEFSIGGSDRAYTHAPGNDFEVTNGKVYKTVKDVRDCYV
jgi:hypothetical protein